MSSPFSHFRGHTFLRSALHEPVVLDIGANRGDFSRYLSQCLGGTYYMVEANPDLHQRLVNGGRFQTLWCAVTAREGTVRFNLARNDEGSSVLDLPKVSIYNCVLAKQVDVPTKTIEGVAQQLVLRDIDLLKMDTEGAELEVLAAVSPEFMRSVSQMTVEFHGGTEFGFGLSREVEAVIARIEKMGFAWLDFSRPGRVDVLFLNRDLHDLRWSRLHWWKLRYEYPASICFGIARFWRTVKRLARRALHGQTNS